MKKVVVYTLTLFLMSFFGSANAWFDKTHIAVGKVAGFDLADYLAAPDIAKLKANDVEAYNHYFNSEEKATITPKLVRDQIEKYNLGIVEEQRGHLYGAIVAAIRAYKDEAGPNNFNKIHHARNDGIVEKKVLANLDKIKLHPISIKTEDELIQHIVRIATKAKVLGYNMEKAPGRDMTEEEAYDQLSDSASLLKAVLEYVGYTGQK